MLPPADTRIRRRPLRRVSRPLFMDKLISALLAKGIPTAGSISKWIIMPEIEPQPDTFEEVNLSNVRFSAKRPNYEGRSIITVRWYRLQYCIKTSFVNQNIWLKNDFSVMKKRSDIKLIATDGRDMKVICENSVNKWISNIVTYVQKTVLMHEWNHEQQRGRRDCSRYHLRVTQNSTHPKSTYNSFSGITVFEYNPVGKD